MRDRPSVGVLSWGTCLSLVEEELDPKEWIESTDDLYIADTRADYEAMGLVVFQALQLRSGLAALATVIHTDVAGLLEAPSNQSGLALLRLVHSAFPHLLESISPNGRRGEATLDGLRWATLRGRQLEEAHLTAGYSWTPYATGGGAHEHVVTTLAAQSERAQSGRTPGINASCTSRPCAIFTRTCG